MLAAEEGLFTGEAPGPEPPPGATDEVEEGGGGRGLGWAGSGGGLAEATVWWAEKRLQVKARHGPSPQQHKQTHDHTSHPTNSAPSTALPVT